MLSGRPRNKRAKQRREPKTSPIRPQVRQGKSRSGPRAQRIRPRKGLVAPRSRQWTRRVRPRKAKRRTLKGMRPIRMARLRKEYGAPLDRLRIKPDRPLKTQEKPWVKLATEPKAPTEARPNPTA